MKSDVILIIGLMFLLPNLSVACQGTHGPAGPTGLQGTTRPKPQEVSRGKNPEQESILTFTHQVLEIEKERDEWQKLPINSVFFKSHFLSGSRQYAELPELQGALQLKTRILLLKSPQSLQHIKDSLVEAYRLEIEAVQLEKERDFSSLSSNPGPQQLYSKIDRFNVDSYLEKYSHLTNRESSWIIAQELRRDVYAEWWQVLRDNGINPVLMEIIP